MSIRRTRARKRNTAIPVRTLPLYAAFDCTGCGECCRDWKIHVEKGAYTKAMEMLATGDHPGRVRPEDAFVLEENPTEEEYAIILGRDDGSCVFLDEDNLCYWHKHFGYETKGWVCRSYPNSSYRTPTSKRVYGTLSCGPMVEMMRDQFAGPMGFIDAPPDMNTAAIERPRWRVKRGAQLLIMDDRRIEAEAMDRVQDALLEFVATDSIPLGIRLRMGRFFLEELLCATRGDAPMKVSEFARYYARIEADATPLYVHAVGQEGSFSILGHALRGMFARMGKLGISERRADRFTAFIDALQLDAPAPLRGIHLERLHRTWFAPSFESTEPLMAAYACHRIAKSQAVPNGGLIPGFTDVLLAMALVWSIAVSDASALGVPVDQNLLTTAIHDTERIFMHAGKYQSFLDADSGLSKIHSVMFAGVLTEIFCGDRAFAQCA